MDLIGRLGVDDRNRYTAKKPERYEALFIVVEPIVLECERGTLKNPWRVQKVETVFLQVRSTFTMVPREAHMQIVYTVPSLVKKPPRLALTPTLSRAATRPTANSGVTFGRRLERVVRRRSTRPQ